MASALAIIGKKHAKKKEQERLQDMLSADSRSGLAVIGEKYAAQNRGKNNGGIVEGIGYVAGNLGLGAAGVGEGIVDIVAATGDLLQGDTTKAKYRFLNNVTGEAQQKLREEYNPGTVMSFTGDVASGIGNSLVFMIPYAGPYLAAAGYVGMGISNAAAQTGDVGLKEIGYGTVTGSLEFVLDKAFGAGGRGFKNIASTVMRGLGREAAKSGAKATAKTAGKSLGRTVLTEVAKGAIGEGAQEAATEAIDPALLRLFNIDEDAKLSWKDVAYSGLVGAFSGGIVTAGPAAINYSSASRAGQEIRESGQTEDVLAYAKKLVRGAEIAKGKYDTAKAEKQTAGEGAGILKKAAVAVGNTRQSMKLGRASRSAAKLSDTVRKNIAVYEAMLQNPNKTEAELRNSDAVLGELRGNMYLLENAYFIEACEGVMQDASAEQKAEFVKLINRMAAENGADKTDYTVEDFDANVDDIRTSLAASAVFEEMWGEMLREERGSREAAQDDAEVTTTAEDAAETTETAGHEQRGAHDGTGTVDDSRAILDALEPVEGVEGFGIQNTQEATLIAAAVQRGASKKSLPSLLNAYRKSGTNLTPAEFAEAWAWGTNVVGRYHLPTDGDSANDAFQGMDRGSREAAAEYGRSIEAERRTGEQAAAEKKSLPAESEADGLRKQEGKAEVKRGRGLIVRDLAPEQYAAYKAAELLAPVLGTDIVIETSLDSMAGKPINGYFDERTNRIHINIRAVRDGRHIALYTLAHEVTHYIKAWSPQKFYALSDFVMSKLGGDAEALITEKMAHLRDIGVIQPETTTQEAYELAHEEVVADGMESVLTDGTVLDELARTDKSIWQRVKDWIGRVIAKIRKYYGGLNGASKTARVLADTMESLDEMERLFTDAVVEAGEMVKTARVGEGDTANKTRKYQARPSKRNPQQLDPRTVTKEDVRGLLQAVKKGEIYGNTYIPLRIGTPAILIEYAKSKRGDVIDDNPIAISAEKAYQAMAQTRRGLEGRPHKFSVDDMISLVESMNDPSYIVYQNHNDRYAMVFERVGALGKKALAIVEIGNTKNEIHMNGYEGGLYNILVTAFPPDSGTIGDLIGNRSNQIIYDKKKDAPQRTSSSMVPSVLNDTSFADSIAQQEGFVNDFEENSQKKFSVSDEKSSETNSDPFRQAVRRWLNGDASEEAEARIEAEAAEAEDAVARRVRLADALMPVVTSQAEYESLKKYRAEAARYVETQREIADRIKKVSDINKEIRELWALRREADPDRVGAKEWVGGMLEEAQTQKDELLAEISDLERSLERMDNRLLKLWAVKPIKEMVARERKRADAMQRSAEQAKERADEKVAKARERADERITEAKERADAKVAKARERADERITEAKERADAKVAKARERADKRIDKAWEKSRAHYEAKEKYESDRREMTVRERAARRVIGRINTLFYHPTRKKHVPVELQSLVERVLSSEDFGDFRELRKNMREMAELEGKIEGLERLPARTVEEQKRLDKMLYKYAMMEGDALNPRRQAEALLAAFEEYQGQAREDGTFDQALMDRLRADVKAMEDAPLSQMGLESIRAVEEFYKLLYHQINNANAMFAQEREARVSEFGDAAMSEVADSKPLKFLSPKAMEMAGLAHVRRFLLKNLKPLTVFEATGSETLLGLFQRVLDGEGVWARTVMDIHEKATAVRERYGWRDWKLDERRTVKTKSGTVELSLSEMLGLYAYSFREQALGHLEGGGFVLDPNATAKIKGQKLTFLQLERRLNNSARYVMDAESLGELASALTAEQRAYAEEMQAILTEMGKLGNEVSLKLYGIEIFNERFYFPMKVKSEYLDSHTGRSGDPNNKNRGMTKETVPNANNPLVLQGFDMIFAEHVNSMATYHAFVLPVEDLMRVLNYRTGMGMETEENIGGFSKRVLVENARAVRSMDKVAALNGDEFESDGVTPLKDRVVAFFDTFGRKVKTKELGEVTVNLSSFRDDKGHGLTWNKVVSFKAIPEVLQNGRVIDVYQPQGKPYTRYTVAAPITIGEKNFYMGVMVQKDNQSNRMYLHDVIAEEATSSFTTEPTARKGEGIRDEGHLFITSILQKALNVNIQQKNNSENGYSTVKAAIVAQYGEDVVKYIEQVVRDLNGGARRDAAASIIDRGITGFKRAATMASLSVLAQQPTSLIRAAAYINPRHLFGNNGFIDVKNHKANWERLCKYAPIGIIKEMGGYDTGVGARTSEYLNAKEYKTWGERAKAFFLPKAFGGDSNYRAEIFGKGAAYADEMAWIQMFEACVSEQAEKLGKTRDSEEVLTAAGERFTEIVRRTQVYDSTLTRSEYMRSKDTGMKMATAFGAEPTTVVSMVADALIRAERGDVKFLRGTAGAVAASIILNALVSSLVYAMRDDDEEKTYAEKYLASLAAETAEGFNPLEYLPFTRDVMSLFKGYEVERTDMTLVGNLMEQLEMLTSSKRSVSDKVLGVTGAVAAFFGVPVTNLTRDARGLIYTFMKGVDTETTTGKGVSVALKDEFTTIFGLFDEQTKNQYQLYQAVVTGDDVHYNRVAARYGSEKEVEQALRKALRENDGRIHEAAMARIEGELEVYESLIEQIESEGHFDRNIVIRAINGEIDYIRDHMEDDTVPEDENAEEDSVEYLYSARDLNEALEREDRQDYLRILEDMTVARINGGKTKAQARAAIKSSVTSTWKKRYIEAWEDGDAEEMKRIRELLAQSELYGSTQDVIRTAAGWIRSYATSKK